MGSGFLCTRIYMIEFLLFFICYQCYNYIRFYVHCYEYFYNGRFPQHVVGFKPAQRASLRKQRGQRPR